MDALRMFRLAELLCRELQAENSCWAPWHLGFQTDSTTWVRPGKAIVRRNDGFGMFGSVAYDLVWFSSTRVEARHSCSIAYLTRSIARRPRIASLPLSCGNWPEWQEAELSVARRGPSHFYEASRLRRESRSH